MPFHFCDKCKGPYCTGAAGCPLGREENVAAEKMNASFPGTKFGRLRAIAKAIKQEQSNVRQP